MVGAYLQPSGGGNSISGTPDTIPAGADWAYKFSHVGNDTYTLNVIAFNSGQTFQAPQTVIVP